MPCMTSCALKKMETHNVPPSQKYNVLVKWTLSKCVIAGVATDADQLPTLFDDSHTSCLPRCTKLFWTMCVRAVSLIADTGRMALAEAYTERETLKSNVTRFSTPETYQITTIYIHKC